MDVPVYIQTSLFETITCYLTAQAVTYQIQIAQCLPSYRVNKS